MALVQAANRRSLDVLAARVYSAWSLAAERQGRLADIRAPLLAAHRAATARHEAPGESVLLGLVLRNYLDAGLYGPAEALRSKTQLPAVHSNPQLCR